MPTYYNIRVAVGGFVVDVNTPSSEPNTLQGEYATHIFTDKQALIDFLSTEIQE